jgi:phosphoribosyl-AMP cyclohydrolase
MQADGNLVIYSTAHKALWGTGTSSPGAFLEVQADGNVVVYSSANKALWSRTGGLVR